MCSIVIVAEGEAINRREKLSEEIYSYAPEYELWMVAWAFNQAQTIYAKGHARMLADWQLTTSQWLAMWMLFLSRGPLKVSDISRVMPIEAHSVGALLDKLSERGLIKRRRSKSDRRTVLVYLTEPGYELLRDVSPGIGTFLNNSVGALSKSDLASLKRISRKLRNNVLKEMSLPSRRADVILGQLTEGISQYQAKKGK